VNNTHNVHITEVNNTHSVHITGVEANDEHHIDESAIYYPGDGHSTKMTQTIRKTLTTLTTTRSNNQTQTKLSRAI